jgi:hypothetical protein
MANHPELSLCIGDNIFNEFSPPWIIIKLQTNEFGGNYFFDCFAR